MSKTAWSIGAFYIHLNIPEPYVYQPSEEIAIASGAYKSRDIISESVRL